MYELAEFLTLAVAALALSLALDARHPRHERQARREEPPYVKVPSYWGKTR